MIYICVKRSCNRVFDEATISCLNCGSDVREVTDEQLKTHRIGVLIQSYNATKDQTKELPQLIFELLSIAFDTGGEHYAEEMRKQRRTISKFIYAVQRLVDDLQYSRIGDDYRDKRGDKTLWERVPPDTKERILALMKETHLA